MSLPPNVRSAHGPTKGSRTPSEVASHMVFQAESWDCERTQMFNVLKEFGERHPTLAVASPRELVFSCFNRALPTPVGGKAGWAAKLQTSLGERVRLIISKPDGSARWSTVAGAISDEDCSFPIIGVSPDYWSEVSNSQQDLGGPEHDIVVLAADKSNALVFDCYLNRIWASGRSRLPSPKTVDPTYAVVSLSMTKLVSLWERTNPPRFYCYVRRTRVRKPSLSEFGRYPRYR